jgi:ankyrin repeat protein
MTHAALLDAIKASKPDDALHLLAKHPALCAQHDEPSALMLALYYRQPTVAETIAERRNFFTIWEAASIGNTPALEKILQDTPESANLIATDGFAPLHLASFFGHARAIQTLLTAGANPNLVATNGTLLQPLHSAATNGSLEACRLLLEAGADATATQQSNFTALHAAALRGNIALAELLLAHGASVTAKADDGRTPIAIAIDSGHPAFAERFQ